MTNAAIKAAMGQYILGAGTLYFANPFREIGKVKGIALKPAKPEKI